jgi:uncharacterized membrane protein
MDSSRACREQTNAAHSLRAQWQLLFLQNTAMANVLQLLHLIAAIVWMGGMTFMLFALRPAALALLEPQPRLRLMGEVWRRFFAIVGVAVLVLLATGGHMFAVGFKAMKTATGTGSVPFGWVVMLVLGVVMCLIFGHIYFAGLRKFQRFVAAAQWPEAGKTAAQIHTMVVTNFVLGWVAIVAMRLLH